MEFPVDVIFLPYTYGVNAGNLRVLNMVKMALKGKNPDFHIDVSSAT